MSKIYNRGLSTNGKLVANGVTYSSGPGEISTQACIHQIVTTGADALTLIDGEQGQRLALVMETDGGDGTLTPVNLIGGTTIVFDAVGETADMIFTGGSWYMIGGSATIS